MVRGAVLAAATTFSAASQAQEVQAQSIIIITPQTPEARAQARERQQNTLLIGLNLLALGHHLLSDPATHTAAQKEAMADTVRTLQDALNAYGTLRPTRSLPVIAVDGKLGADTAALAIRIAAIERMSSVFIDAPPGAAPRDASAMAALRERLTTLSPMVYAQEMRALLQQDNQRLVRLNGQALTRAFGECVSADNQAYAPEIVSREINSISAAPTSYTSPYIPYRCRDILRHMPPTARVQAQINFFNARVMPPENPAADWCAVSGPKTCLEYKV